MAPQTIFTTLTLLVPAAVQALCPLGYDYGGHVGWDNASDPWLYHPRFHLMPPVRENRSSGMNDINGGFYFNGTYHVSYQDHLNCLDDINQANQTFSHLASVDLVFWHHLTPLITDNEHYDSTDGPWDGPGFICHGQPMFVYNSHMQGNDFNKQTKTATIPPVLSDPWLNGSWVRHELNPSLTFQGPSTLAPPWLHEDGHYVTFAVDTSGQCFMYASNTSDCLSWAQIGTFTPCYQDSPQIYTLPRSCPSCPPTPANPTITHVYSNTDNSDGVADTYYLGHLDITPPTWTSASPAQVLETGKQNQWTDGRGTWSQSFLDASGQRRITVGWVPPGVSPSYKRAFPGFAPLWHMSTSLREMFYDARLKLLTFLPIAEYVQLHEAIVAQEINLRMEPGEQLSLGQGRQLDIVLNLSRFERGRVSLLVASSTTGANSTNISLTQSPEAYLPQHDIRSHDYHYFAVNYTDPRLCQAACENDTRCAAWVYVARPAADVIRQDDFPVPRCCLKSEVATPVADAQCTAGVLPRLQVQVDTSTVNTIPGHSVPYPTASAVVPLLASDEHLQLRVLYDRSIVEVFAQEGRRVITATTYPMPDATLVRFDNAANQSLKVNVTVHAMGCAWLD